MSTTVSYETCPTSAPFFGFMGVTAALCFASKSLFPIGQHDFLCQSIAILSMCDVDMDFCFLLSQRTFPDLALLFDRILTNFDVYFVQTSVLPTVLLSLVWELLPWVSCILVWS